jgi:hypothetical protein
MDRSLRAELMDEVDDVWSETVRHLPLVAGLQDTARDPREFSAVMRTGDRASDGMGFGRGRSERTSIAAAGGHLRIDRIANPDVIVRKGDKVVALDRDSTPAFEILSVDDRSHLRLICELGDA